eukprot:6800841-Prymnesium_polylepis.1
MERGAHAARPVPRPAASLFGGVAPPTPEAHALALGWRGLTSSECERRALWVRETRARRRLLAARRRPHDAVGRGCGPRRLQHVDAAGRERPLPAACGAVRERQDGAAAREHGDREEHVHVQLVLSPVGRVNGSPKGDERLRVGRRRVRRGRLHGAWHVRL